MMESEKNRSSLLELALNILLFIIQYGMYSGTSIYSCGLSFSYDANKNRISVKPSVGIQESQGVGSILTIETNKYNLIPLDPYFLNDQDEFCIRFNNLVAPYGYDYEALCNMLMIFYDSKQRKAIDET